VRAGRAEADVCAGAKKEIEHMRHGAKVGTLGAALALALAVTAPSARAASKSFTIVSGGVQVRGGEAACFRLTDTSVTSDRLLVRVRFTGAVPRGYVTLDGARSAAFRERSEEFAFVIDPRGTHRVELKLEERSTIDWLSVTSTESAIAQESCASYEADTSRRVDLEVGSAEQVNRFETEEERRAREAEERRREDDRRRWEDERRATTPRDDGYSSRVPANAGMVVPAGTEESMTLQGDIDTRTAYVGQNFAATLDHDVVVDGRVAIPNGTRVEGHVVETQDAGRFGRSKLNLGFDRAVLDDGRVVPVQGTVQRLGKGSAGKQAGIIGGSAVGGALLGKILGGDDKDALLGAVVGGAIAAGSIAAKEGESIVVPAGSVVTISLDNNAQIPYPQGARR
jgi:hypothetical protein